jgi:hypothetical protein
MSILAQATFREIQVHRFFNYETHKIIGALISGMTPYELHEDYYKTSLCHPTNCIGEKVIRIALVFEK